MLIKGYSGLPNDIRSILLLQLGDIGDLILSLPAIKALRENYPKASVIVAVREKARELLEDCPWVNDVISVKTQRGTLIKKLICQKDIVKSLQKHRFELAIDFRTGDRSAILAFLSGAKYRIGFFAKDGRLWRNRLFTHLVKPAKQSERYFAETNLNIISHFNLNIKDRFPELIVALGRKAKSEAILKQEKVPFDKPIIAVHPFSLWKYKELGISQAVSLIEHINAKYHCSVIITGSQEERMRAGEVVSRCRTKAFNLAGKTTIGELPGVLQACKLFVGVDTGALHIAAAVGAPTVGIFGPSSSKRWAPRGNKHLVVSKNMQCIPCRQKGCQDSGRSLCLEELTTEEIMEKVETHLAAMPS
jgi:lipopolysaccharide heptosyltransferase II